MVVPAVAITDLKRLGTKKPFFGKAFLFQVILKVFISSYSHLILQKYSPPDAYLGHEIG